jgi:hypothetical protein
LDLEELDEADLDHIRAGYTLLAERAREDMRHQRSLAEEALSSSLEGDRENAGKTRKFVNSQSDGGR